MHVLKSLLFVSANKKVDIVESMIEWCNRLGKHTFPDSLIITPLCFFLQMYPAYFVKNLYTLEGQAGLGISLYPICL